MNPKQAILALAGMLTHHEFSQSAIAVVWNHSVIPMNLITAPTSIMDADNSPVKRMPVLSRITPAMMRKPQTFTMYSDAA